MWVGLVVDAGSDPLAGRQVWWVRGQIPWLGGRCGGCGNRSPGWAAGVVGGVRPLVVCGWGWLWMRGQTPWLGGRCVGAGQAPLAGRQEAAGAIL